MRLREGDKAPPLDVVDTEGNPVRLRDYRGGRLHLSFYRYASCPYCNLRVSRLGELAHGWKERGLSLVGVFQSPPEGIANYVGKQAPPFPIVSDPRHHLYDLYRVESSWAGFLKAGVVGVGDLFAAGKKGFMPGRMEGRKALLPAEFLIGPDGTIERAFYGSAISDHLPLQEIDEWLA